MDPRAEALEALSTIRKMSAMAADVPYTVTGWCHPTMKIPNLDRLRGEWEGRRDPGCPDCAIRTGRTRIVLATGVSLGRALQVYQTHYNRQPEIVLEVDFECHAKHWERTDQVRRVLYARKMREGGKDRFYGLPENTAPITDEELAAIAATFFDPVKLCKKCGVVTAHTEFCLVCEVKESGQTPGTGSSSTERS